MLKIGAAPFQTQPRYIGLYVFRNRRLFNDADCNTVLSGSGVGLILYFTHALDCDAV